MVTSGARIPVTGESGFPLLKKMRNAVKQRLRGLVMGLVTGEQEKSRGIMKRENRESPQR